MKDDNSMKSKVSLLLVIFLFSSVLPLSVYADTDNSVTIRAPAVSQTSSGYIGAVLYISVSALPGDDHIYVDTWPLTELDTQASARLAVEVAGRITGKDVSQYDFYYVIRTDSPVIGGPSAGGVMTVATIAALEDLEIDPAVMMTGMINPDESIGPVGSIVEKLDASAELGIETFLVPWGQTIITTQETTRNETGGMIQIITKPKKVNVVEYAKENYNIDVIEVEDINDALFYFTGKKFSEKKVEGEININTDFLSKKADETLKRDIKYHDTIEGDLNSLDINSYEKGYLEKYLDTAGDFIDKAKKDMNDGEYYTALSDLFNSEIYTGVVDEYTHSNDPSKRIKDLEDKINSIDSELKEKRGDIRGIVSLEFLSAAEKRLKEAYDYLDEAKNYEKNYDTVNVAQSIAYADKRTYTVKLWLDLAVEYSQGEKISLDDLKDDAWKRIEEAKLVYVYVRSMLGETSLSEASQLLSASQSEYDANRYTSALFYAIESAVYSSIAIELGLSSEDPSLIAEKIQRAQNDAKIAIECSKEDGHESLLAECYYEYASNFEEKNDAVNAFRMYEYAKEVALAYKHLGAEGMKVPTVMTTSTHTTTPAKTLPEKGSTLILVLVSGLIGFFVGILIKSGRKTGENIEER